MDNSLMPAFRLVGAQIKTAKAELSRSRPKGSPRLTQDQKFWRDSAKAFYTTAATYYLRVEAVQFDVDADPREDLRDASANALYAQLDWRKAHPSEDRLIEVVKP